MNYDPLRNELIEIARSLQPHGISLIVGGGYGLYLRTELVLSKSPVTRFAEPPFARSTEDLDFFLSAEILADATKMETLRDIISGLGYTVRTEFFQFEKPVLLGDVETKIKIDLLAPVPDPASRPESIRVGKPRISNKNVEHLHARRTDEAISLNEGLQQVVIYGPDPEVKVFLPHPFTYLLLKLFALRDHLAKANKFKAPEHAADLYQTVGMITQDEWNEAVKFSKHYCGHEVMIEAASILNELYTTVEDAGPIEAYKVLGRSDVVTTNMAKVIEDLRELLVVGSKKD